MRLYLVGFSFFFFPVEFTNVPYHPGNTNKHNTIFISLHLRLTRRICRTNHPTVSMPTMDFLKSDQKGSDPRSELSKELSIAEGQPIPVKYFSKDVPIPPGFLSLASPPADARPVTLTTMDWRDTALPEYEGRYAVVLDNAVSPSECQALLGLAESSVDLPRVNEFWKTPGAQGPWRPAMVNAGAGLEVLDSSYRNSERLVWDCQEVVDRLWARCLRGEVGEVLRERLEVLDGARDERIVGASRRAKLWGAPPQRWEMRKLNERMRFLKYGPGQFFRRELLPPSLPRELSFPKLWLTSGLPAHCDGNYSEEVDGKVLKTFFTIHLYLNDSVAEAGEEAELVGGATSFVSSDGSRKTDVDPKAGRVLIFQQQGLYHAGDDVVEGTKYTMRTEIMYELIRPEKPKVEPVETRGAVRG